MANDPEEFLSRVGFRRVKATTSPNLTGPITSVGNTTSVASQTGTGSTFVMNNSPILIAPRLGTPFSGVLTNCTGTAAGLTAGTVTTNANLTGPVTSIGNTTSIASGINLPGNPTTTTQSAGNSSTRIATTAYVDSAITLAFSTGISTSITTAPLTGGGTTGTMTFTNGLLTAQTPAT